MAFLASAGVALAACMLGGGSSRADVLSLVYLRPLLVIAIAAMLIARAGRFEWAAVRIPVVLLGILGLIMLLQLVPLPPALWASLPGHAPVAAQLDRVGMATVWRPLSLTPELTLNSLMALLPPLAVLIFMAGATDKERGRAAYVLTGIGAASALLGVVQLVSGLGYFYQHADDTLPIGFFTNRNHQAALLACCLPALRIIALTPRATPGSRLFQRVLCGAIGLFFVLMILLSGSRSGMLMAVVGAAGAVLMKSAHGQRDHANGGRRLWYRRAMLPVGAVVVLVTILVSAYVSGRAVSFNRFQQLDTVLTDQRVTFAPLTWKLAGDFFPTGAGFGSFDPIYRMAEPDWALHQTYFNHAHNDVIEAAITGGVPFILLIAAFIALVARRVFETFRRAVDRPAKNRVIFAATGILILLLSSITDYPLRTPIMAAVMALFSAIVFRRQSEAG